MGLRTAYLTAYNLAQAAGWAVALWRLALHIAATGSITGAYEVAGSLVGELGLGGGCSSFALAAAMALQPAPAGGK